MDRSRSKRYYYDQDYESENPPRTKQRYSNRSHSSSHHHYDHRRPSAAPHGGGRKTQDPSLMVTTSYRILCHDLKAGGVIGKSGSIIKAIRQHTGAWINVHELIPGDEERIIEITDTRRRDPEGRMPSFSPAQEALFLIHERILESDAGGYVGGEDDVDYGRGGGGNRVATRLVVSRMHVGSLLGKGGKIIEQMRMETKTHIRILPRDHSLPRCVALSEEIVQVVGDMNAVKNAMSIISSRLRESQHRDRTNYHGRPQSPERFYPPDDDFIPHMNNTPRRTSVDGFGSRLSGGYTSERSNNYNPRSSGYEMELGSAPSADNAHLFSGDDLVFQILCPIDRVDRVVGESDGIIELLQNEIGVDVKVADPVAGSNEQIIIISSDEGPDDELFPAQEALLHIQTRIVDLVPEKENRITTRLVVPSGDIGCLEGRDASLAEIRRLTGANIQILHREELPVCVSGTDEIVQIEGEIKASREALVEVTSRLRSCLYQEFFPKDMLTPTMLASNPVANAVGLEVASSHNVTPVRERYAATETDPPPANYLNIQTMAAVLPAKDSVGSVSATMKTESERREDMPSGLNRIPVPIVTRSILEVVIPQHAVPKLITKSKNKLAQISELSGASVKLIEDRPETTEKTILISGTPDQAERAQSLLQGFILSTQEDAP
ncbi:RNA-binding KH domain-containing protein RCF3 [Rhododendron vialii]|uniref:RNA-binding KH domain-containing protein RCF3 n=1 Tax=Rhododendron vialii TaxID=182163 RepID=UPI00265EF669|nr:RNA-binding KH domain-containing protein RCF3 [Rhododendron vialii]